MRDLGYFIEKTLKVSHHVCTVSRKALGVLHSLFRNIALADPSILVKLYKTYVLPHLEYACQVWSPYLKKDIEKVEKVQHVFTRMLYYRVFPSDSYPASLPTYQVRLKKLGLKSLFYRRVVLDLIFAFRVFKKEIRLQGSKYWCFKPSNGRTGSFAIVSRKLNKTHFRLTSNEFFTRTADWLHKLPVELITSQNSASFKRKLRAIDVLQLLKITDVS